AVVVPIGTEVLGSPAEQGFITRRVAVWINVLGTGALALFFLDWLPRRGWARLGIWVGLASLQVVLFLVWPRMDSYLDPENYSFLDHCAFRFWHKLYLWVFTAQWFLGLIHTWLLLRGWQQPAALPPEGAKP